MKLTKKKVLIVSVIVSIFLLIVNQFGNSKICAVFGFEHYSCLNFLFSFEVLILVFWPITFFSLITYKMRDEVFHSWLGFTKWWVPMSMILVLITPDGQGGGYMPSLIDKQVIAFLTSFIFVIISIFLITYKSIKLRGK